MHWHIVDQAGKVWQSPAELLSHCYGLQFTWQTSIDYLVREMGCVLVSLAPNACLLKAAPHKTSYVTYLSVADLVNGAAPERVMLTWYDSSWHDQLFGGSRAALRHLLQLQCKRRAVGRFHVKHRDVRSLEDDHPLRTLIDMWRANAGHINSDQHVDTMTRLSSARFLMVKPDIESAALKFSRLGAGWTLYGDRTWTIKCVGQRVEDQPDIAYGRWVADSLREALLIDEPQVRDIDAIVRDPIDRTDRRFRYTRLTLPVRSKSGARQLLSTPTLNPSLDLQPRLGVLD